MAAEAAQRSALDKRRVMKELIEMSPIERILTTCGGKADEALHLYDEFLDKMSDASIRKALEEVDPERKYSTQIFRDMKNNSHRFTWALKNLIRDKYVDSHPIHTSILF